MAFAVQEERTESFVKGHQYPYWQTRCAKLLYVRRRLISMCWCSTIIIWAIAPYISSIRTANPSPSTAQTVSNGWIVSWSALSRGWSIKTAIGRPIRWCSWPSIISTLARIAVCPRISWHWALIDWWEMISFRKQWVWTRISRNFGGVVKWWPTAPSTTTDKPPLVWRLGPSCRSLLLISLGFLQRSKSLSQAHKGKFSLKLMVFYTLDDGLDRVYLPVASFILKY